MEILRQCKCGVTATEEEELELFVKHTGSKYGRRNQCKACGVDTVRKAQGRTGPKQVRPPKGTYTTISGRSIWQRYGLSEAAHKELLESVNNQCEVCGSTDKLCVDHCHNTGAVRGILCNACNTGIGQLGDTAESVFKAYMYLLNK